MSWIILGVAGLLEVVWALAMKQSQGFTRLWPSFVTLLAMAGSFGLLALALRSLPLGTAYAIWTGIGTLGAFAAGIALFGEPLSAVRLGAVVLILGGMVLLKLS
ncbi:DMT family transporter [Novosphingobium sp. 9]|uniref:DMT family transporter n=1 Tax=Novosphingobium sp. 9 TaxID=2025349 RepID=UPI0021B50A9A|nr:multidrug efflux SMR transporter [Novosphingobium sp. 9]